VIAAVADQLLPLVYDDLRCLAAARLAQEKAGQLRRTDAVQQTKKHMHLTQTCGNCLAIG
jgi:hypothetical protein